MTEKIRVVLISMYYRNILTNVKEKPNLNTKMKNQFKEYEINRYKHDQHTILSFFSE